MSGYLFTIFRSTRFNKPKKMPTFNKFRAYLFFGAFLGVLIVLVLSSDSSQTLSAKRLTVGKDGTRYSFGPLRFTLQIMLGALQVIFVYILLNIKNRRLELGIILGLMFLTALLISKRSIIFFSLIPVIMISMHQVNAKKILKASILGSLVIIAVFRITQLRSEAALGNAFRHHIMSTKNTNASWQTRKEAAIARGEGNLAQLYVERAEGSEMWDVEGNRYIDFATGIAVCNTGHTHPKVTEAVIEQVKRFSHTCVIVTPYDSAVRLAEQLNELAPGPNAKKINLCNHRRRSRRERR